MEYYVNATSQKKVMNGHFFFFRFLEKNLTIEIRVPLKNGGQWRHANTPYLSANDLHFFSVLHRKSGK